MINMDDTVSIVIPAYNASSTINRCLNSVINQSHNNLEIIIVDDGSTDLTGTICDDLAKEDSRITVIHKVNGGVSSARNAGIDKASGEYLLFIDSDDYVELDYIQLLIDYKNRYDSFDNIWFAIDDLTNNKPRAFSDTSLHQVMQLYYYTEYCSGSPCNKLYSLSIIKENSLYMPEDISLGEDLIFNLKYLDNTNGLIKIIDKQLYHYSQVNDESLTKKYRKDLYETNNIVNNYLKEYLTKWNSPESEFELLDRKIFSNYMDALFNTFSEDNNDSFIKKIKFNNSILKNQEFIKLLDIYKDNINQFLYYLYKTKNYFLVYISLKLTKLIKKH